MDPFKAFQCSHWDKMVKLSRNTVSNYNFRDKIVTPCR